MITRLLIYILLFALVYAQSPCDKILFVDRAGWYAKNATSIKNLTKLPLSFYLIHHTYDPASCYDNESCIPEVQDIQRYHMMQRQWSDIGYSFLVGEDGKVYEGRGWNREASHSTGWNRDAYSIAIIGNFMQRAPNKKALTTTRLWIDCGVKLGYVKKNYYILTHRQTQRIGHTISPGAHLSAIVRKWPRYCSFQNIGDMLNKNETRISRALNFCKKEFKHRSSATHQRFSTMSQAYIVFNYFLLTILFTR